MRAARNRMGGSVTVSIHSNDTDRKARQNRTVARAPNDARKTEDRRSAGKEIGKERERARRVTEKHARGDQNPRGGVANARTAGGGRELEYSLRTKPWKKKLIQPMMTICGTIMTICVFIPAIMPSMALGSVSGLGGALAGASALGGPSLRYVPSANAWERYCEIAL